MVKKDAEFGACVLKTAQSVWEKSIFYQKSFFFLFVTTSVVFICKFAVKVVCSSTGGKSAATVLTQMVLKACKKKNSSVWPHLISECLTHIQVFCSSKLVLQSHSTSALTVQWNHLVFIRSELLPAAERFVVFMSIPQCCPSCIHSPDLCTFFSFP